MQDGDRPARTDGKRITRELIRKRRRFPILVYRLKDILIKVRSNKYFIDSLLVALMFVSFVAGFPYYPLVIAALILILLFVITLYHPFLGLIVFMVVALPALIYQISYVAWIFLFVISMSLIYGYMHYRTIVFGYTMFFLAFSVVGLVLEIPVLVLAVLVSGFKRSAIITTIAIIGIVAVSGVFGVQNSAYILYNGAGAHIGLPIGNISEFLVMNKPQLHFFNIVNQSSAAFSNFASIQSAGEIDVVSGFMVNALYLQLYYLIQIAAFIAVGFAIEYMALNTRSKFKGTRASLIGVCYPIIYVGLGTGLKLYAINYVAPFVSFIILVIFVGLLEFYNIDVVKAMEVKKQDIRMKFGEAFEDLQEGNVSEKFDDIGDYDAIKKELKEAVISPLENVGISRAYNIKPAKGILFFGLPGTGKTMIMRALANEIHTGFYYVKATNLISSYPGESEKLISDIFGIAKKHAPCVLFIDEIDSIATNRNYEGIDEIHRHALSQLLVEMDGFQKMDGVIIVGATNVPNMLDPAILRPGRFDKSIYMPLPDLNARKEIFKIYLKKFPISDDIDFDKIAEASDRYSGADIKAVCEAVGQTVAQEALSEHKVLEIAQSDIMNVISATKPSTSLAQLEAYNTFRIDFGREKGQRVQESVQDKVMLKNVIGLDDAKKAIIDAIEVPLLHPELIEKYDIKTINGLLLFGPPGTGKTMLMRAIGNELTGVTMLEIDNVIMQQSDSESAATVIKNIFYRAYENKPAIIFIDEVDGIVPMRRNSAQKDIEVTTELLKDMDGIKRMSQIIVVGATNRPEALDEAVLRPGRFDKIVFIKPPDAHQRALLFKEYIKNAPYDKSMDFEKLGAETKGFTGADIANVCREVKMHALESHIKTSKESVISIGDIENILKAVKPSAPESALSAYLAFLAKYGQR